MASQTGNLELNSALLQLSKRAETVERGKLVETFVDVGPLLTLLRTNNHQVIHGRRGTGKTHALLYLSESVTKAGDVSVYIDMRTVGSTGGLYSDEAVPLSERATRLIIDTLGELHETLLHYAVAPQSDLNLAEFGPLLDQLATAITEVSVQGPTQIETENKKSTKSINSSKLTLATDGAALLDERKQELGSEGATKVSQSGIPRHRLHFGALQQTLAKITKALGRRRIWFIIDE